MSQTSGKFDAIIFDLLTALLDSWSLWNRIAGSDAAGLRWRMEYLRLTYGAGAYRDYDALVIEAAEAAGLDHPEAIGRQLIDGFAAVEPWDDVGDMLGDLRALPNGPKLAIATNCSNALAKDALSAIEFDFDVVVTAEAAGYYKPRPEVYQTVLRQLGAAPDRTLFVAGSAADVPGAKACGMPVYWHNRLGSEPLPGAPAAEHHYDSLAPLKDLIRAMS